MVFASAGKLFLLFSHTPVNLLTHLAELKSSTEDLVLLLLESSLGFLESCLQLLLLLLQVAPLLVQVMDGTTTLSELVQQILDFVREILVLPLDNVKMLNSLILGSLQPE